MSDYKLGWECLVIDAAKSDEPWRTNTCEAGEIQYAAARIAELEAKQQKAKENYHEICGLIDAHNKRCDEECQAMKFFKHPEGLECSSNDKCDLCPRRYRIED